MADEGNSMRELISYFSVPEKPCTTKEFMEFWKSLDDSDKAYYKSAPEPRAVA